MFIRKFVGFTGILLCCLRSFAALLLGPNLVPDLRAIIREDLLDASYSVQQNAGPHGEDILLKHRTQRENYTLLSYDFPVLEPNKIFQFSVWLKTTAIDTEYTEVCSVEFYHRGKYQDSEILYVAKGDSNWHEVSKLITTQRVFDHARIVFFLQRNVSGEVCFASPSLREIIPDQESIRQECENLKPDLLPAAVRAGQQPHRAPRPGAFKGAGSLPPPADPSLRHRKPFECSAAGSLHQPCPAKTCGLAAKAPGLCGQGCADFFEHH